MYLITLNFFFLLLTSFFNLQFQDIDGNTVSMSSFQGKKILIVNIATGSDSIMVAQLAGLQYLQEQYADSLVVIAFPSNSFGKESRSNAEIKQFCQTRYHISFILAANASVNGTNIQPVFNWLAHTTENGDIDAEAHADFQKFLIDQQGHIAAVLSAKVKPLDSLMIKTITANY